MEEEEEGEDEDHHVDVDEHEVVGVILRLHVPPSILGISGKVVGGAAGLDAQLLL